MNENLPYILQLDNSITLILLTCFIISATLLGRVRNLLINQLKDFILHKKRSSFFTSKGIINTRYHLWFVIQTCILSAIYLINYFYHYNPSLFEKYTSWKIFIFYTLISISYLTLKWCLYQIIAWTFFNKGVRTIWNNSYLILVHFLGIVLFMVNLLTIYFNLDIEISIILAISLLSLFKIMIFYKWYKLFFNKLHGIILLIAYFCALEIIPCFILFQGFIEFNNILLIKN